MRARCNSNTANATAKVDPDSPEYRERVALPVMAAVDAMPFEYRLLVNEFGYVDVYRAWRKGWTPAEIRGEAVNGVFQL
jgi:hypothetical protein